MVNRIVFAINMDSIVVVVVVVVDLFATVDFVLVVAAGL